MAAAVILDLIFFKLLTVGHAKKVEPLHYAKFQLNRSNPGRHMVIFRLLKMAAAAILNFKSFKFFLRSERSRGSNYVTMPNFVEIAQNAVEICQFYYYASLA